MMPTNEERLARIEQWKVDFIPTFVKFSNETDQRLIDIEEALRNGLTGQVREIKTLIEDHIEESNKRCKQEEEQKKDKKDIWKWFIRAIVVATTTTVTGLAITALWAFFSGYFERILILLESVK